MAVLCALTGRVLVRCSGTPEKLSASEWIAPLRAAFSALDSGTSLPLRILVMSHVALRYPLSIASVIPPRGVPVRAPMHPGRLLARTCLAPLGLSQSEANFRHNH